jgi:predicted nucleic acid-binding protein
VAEVFVDTSGWTAFHVRTETHHAEVAALIRRWQSRRTTVVTTNYILAELVSLLVSRLWVPHARRSAITDAIRTSSWVTVAHIDPTIDAEAWELLAQRPDKDWSLVDAASFAVMTRRKISEALTTDHHFDQAGFNRLLK